MPNMEDCTGEVAAVGGVSRAEARAVMQKILDQSDREGRDPMAVAKELGETIDYARIKAKANQLGNLRKRMVADSHVTARINIYRDLYGEQGLAMAIRAEVRSFNTTAGRSRLSAENVARTLSNQYLGGAMRDLRNAGGLDKAFRNYTFARSVGKEMYELSMKGAGKEGNPGVTGDSRALQAAQILYGYQSMAKQALNKAGAWIGDYAGYITKTQHNGLAMYKAGFEGWRDYILTKLDSKTFDSVEDQDKFLHGVYDALVTGVHVGDEGRIGFKDPAFAGASNLAKKISESRELHFKDADSWLDYQEKFGNGPFHEQVFSSLTRAGKDEALLSRFGTNPRSEYEALIQRMSERWLGKDNAGVAYLKKRKDALMREFGNLDGTNSAPINEQVAAFAQGLRNIQSMSKLGNVAWTHLASMAIKVRTLKSQGINGFEAWKNVLDSLIQGAHGRGHDEQELRDLLLAGFDGSHAHYLGRFTPDDGVAGSMSKATSYFMQYNGLNYVLGAQKSGAKAIMARHLGRQLGKDFDSLPADLRNSFTEYGISSKEWDALRAVQDHYSIGDRQFVTPDAALRAGLDPKDGQELGMKLATYYDDIANRSIVTPGVAEKGFLSAVPGTAGGEVLRMFMQFKTWPIAATRQVLGTELRGRGTRPWQARAVSMASLAAGATVLGYLRMTLSDALKGVNPKDPLNLSTILASLAQGGGLGILGDVMFSQGMPDSNALAGMLAGPTVSTIGQYYMAYQEALQAANTDSTVKHKYIQSVSYGLMKAAMANVPFVNLWFSRTILDYLVIWHLQEMLNPGYQKRYEQRMKANGQTFWLSPANAVQ